jgi:hypothetical protein
MAQNKAQGRTFVNMAVNPSIPQKTENFFKMKDKRKHVALHNHECILFPL